MDFALARKRLGMTQEEIAKLIGVHQSTVALWESGRGKPGIRNLLRAADVYKCTVDDLLENGSNKEGI